MKIFIGGISAGKTGAVMIGAVMTGAVTTPTRGSTRGATTIHLACDSPC